MRMNPLDLIKKFRKSTALLAAILCVVLFGAEDCDGTNEGDGQKSEVKTQQDNYDKRVKAQPAHTMDYSSTRDTVNFWIDTWKDPDAVSYTYLVSGGKPYAFVVLKGLPVSYCTSLTPNYKIITPEIAGDNNVPLAVNAPSIDAVYYSGGDCQRYYGRDATTGTYVEFTAGADTTLVTRTEPLPLNLYQDALPLGDTNAQEAQKVAPATTPAG